MLSFRYKLWLIARPTSNCERTKTRTGDFIVAFPAFLSTKAPFNVWVSRSPFWIQRNNHFLLCRMFAGRLNSLEFYIPTRDENSGNKTNNYEISPSVSFPETFYILTIVFKQYAIFFLFIRESISHTVIKRYYKIREDCEILNILQLVINIKGLRQFLNQNL